MACAWKGYIQCLKCSSPPDSAVDQLSASTSGKMGDPGISTGIKYDWNVENLDRQLHRLRRPSVQGQAFEPHHLTVSMLPTKSKDGTLRENVSVLVHWPSRQNRGRFTFGDWVCRA